MKIIKIMQWSLGETNSSKGPPRASIQTLDEESLPCPALSRWPSCRPRS